MPLSNQRLHPLHQTSPLSGEIGARLHQPRDGVHEAEFRHMEYGITLRVATVQDGVRLSAYATLPTDSFLFRYSADGERGTTEIRFPEVVRVTEEWGDTDTITDVLLLAVQVADTTLSRMGEVRDARAARGELPRALPDGDRSQFHIAVLQTHPVGGKMHELFPDERKMSLTVYPQGQSPEEYKRKRYHSWSQAPKLPLETLIGIERGVRPAAVEDGQEDADDHLYAAGFSRWSEWTLGLGQYTALVLPTDNTPQTPPAPAIAVPDPAPQNPPAAGDDEDPVRDRSIAPDGKTWRRAHVVVAPSSITDSQGRAELSIVTAALDDEGFFPDRDDETVPFDLESTPLPVAAGFDNLPAIKAAALKRLREEGWYAHGDWANEGADRIFYVCRVPEEDDSTPAEEPSA